MFGFEVQHSELCVGGVPVRQLAARVGQTPFYAYDRRLVSERVTAVRQVLPAATQLYYAVKANPMPALLSHLASRVDGMDVASAGELKAALDAGCAPERVCFAGPAKRDDELGQAVAAGVLLHVESAREVAALQRIMVATGRVPRVALRINPDFEMRSAGMRMGGGAQVFGVDLEQAAVLLRQIGQAGLAFEGFHVYAGSQVLQADWLAQCLVHAADMLIGLADLAPGPVRSVNLGGGWGIPYHGQDRPLDAQALAPVLAQVQARLQAVWPQAVLVQELGRYLVGEAGVYVTQVIDRKVSRGQTFLVLDGGMHQHLAATGNLGQVIRRPYPMALGHAVGQPVADKVHLAGPLCTPLDALGHGVALPAAAPGDLLVVFQSGAYGASASPQGFLSHPACIEVLV